MKGETRMKKLFAICLMIAVLSLPMTAFAGGSEDSGLTGGSEDSGFTLIGGSEDSGFAFFASFISSIL
jgi:hypothetical protein